jgi:nitrogen regulatory protein PII-like uncharacterized protein
MPWGRPEIRLFDRKSTGTTGRRPDTTTGETMHYDIELAIAQVRDLEDKSDSVGTRDDRESVDRILDILLEMKTRYEEEDDE